MLTAGNLLTGDFVWALAMTGIVAGWTRSRGTWNKSSQGIQEYIRFVPVPVDGLRLRYPQDSRNGSELLNHHLVRYITDHPRHPVFNHSREKRHDGTKINKNTTPRNDRTSASAINSTFRNPSNRLFGSIMPSSIPLLARL